MCNSYKDQELKCTTCGRDSRMLLARKAFGKDKVSYLLWDKFSWNPGPSFTSDSNKVFPKAYFLKVSSPIQHSVQNCVFTSKVTLGSTLLPKKPPCSISYQSRGCSILPTPLYKFSWDETIYSSWGYVV